MSNETAREILSNVLKRREELQLELDALESLIQTYSKLLNTGYTPSESTQLDLKLLGSARSKAAYVSTLLEEVRRILIAEGQPLKRGALLRRLRENGFEVEGRDKNKVLGTNIWRSGRFMHIDGKGYWPNDVPLSR